MKQKHILLIIGLFFYALGCMTQTAVMDWPAIQKETKPWTRWWWLGSAVDSANITHNLDALSRAGVGGVEITPIYGVKGGEGQFIDYLSSRWMKMLSFTEAEANRLGMGVDMNNGTGWPFGGPEVSLEDAVTKAIFKDNRLEIGKTGQQVKRAAPGGQGNVLDHLNKEAVIRYFSKFDKAFAENHTSFPNSFFNDSYEVYGGDWTPGMLDEFEKRRGYRLQDYFPDLLADGNTERSARVIADYRETVSDILHDNFTQTWTDWAHSHGATTRNQAHGSPANLLDLYALVDIPECESFGITDFDIPGLRKDSIYKKNDSNPMILKFASSAAHVAGKKYTSSETLTWLTEHFRTSLSQCKPEIDFMFAAGVNHVFFHGTTYSPKEAAWPGWKFYAAIDMSPTNSIWRDAPAFFDYITRCQSFLQSGVPDNDFLLYFPVYDIWHEKRGNYYVPFAIHDVLHELPEFEKSVERILKAGYDLDYISDRLLQNVKVENGLLNTGENVPYKCLIIPSVKRMPLETLSKILELKKQGAHVIFEGGYPEDVPGLYKMEERRKTFVEIMEQIRNLPDSTICAPGELFVADFGGKMIRRKNADGYHYFMAMLKNNPVDGWIPISVKAESAVFYDPLTGKTGKAALRENNGKTEIYLQLKPGQSMILKTFTKKDVSSNHWNYWEETGKIFELNNHWRLQFIESEPAVKQTFELEKTGSWTDLPNDTLQINMATALYSKTFHFNKVAGREYLLCLGDVRESAEIRINGKKVATLFAVPFETLVGEYLKDGENRLEIEVTNLPANRIADYDRRGVEWRIFHEINFVDIQYKDAKYDKWAVMPSGLLGPVVIREMSVY
jgi:hypothetical protein